MEDNTNTVTAWSRPVFTTSVFVIQPVCGTMATLHGFWEICETVLSLLLGFVTILSESLRVWKNIKSPLILNTLYQSLAALKFRFQFGLSNACTHCPLLILLVDKTKVPPERSWNNETDIEIVERHNISLFSVNYFLITFGVFAIDL